MWGFILISLQVLVVFNTHAAVDAPVINCVALDSNNAVTLTWTVPPDPNNEFFKYTVYRRPNSTGTFAPLIDITTYAQSSVTITGSFAQANEFYMVTVSNGGADISAPSNTVSPIDLSLAVMGLNVEINFSNAGVPGSDSVYRVYRSVNNNTWQLVAQTDFAPATLLDSVKLCDAYLMYKVEYLGLGGCINRSNQAKTVVADNAPPLQTNLICASVDTATGYVNLIWEKSKSPDVHGYRIIYFEPQGNFIRLKNIFGGDVVSGVYDEFEINALTRPETLSIAPFDSCFDSVAMWYNQAADSLRFQTLFIDTNFYNRCKGEIGITWNMPTQKHPVGVRNLSGFRIYRRTNNQSAQLMRTLSANDSVFIDSGLTGGNLYTYIVAAYDKILDKEALSNPLKINTKAADQPDYLYISSVRSDGDMGNAVKVRADSVSDTKLFALQRSLFSNKSFQSVGTLNNNGRSVFTITDSEARQDQTDYYYRVLAYDKCLSVIARSEVARSIYIDGYAEEQKWRNHVYWNPYEGFEHASSTVGQYALYRSTSGGADTLLGFFSADQFVTDDLTRTGLIDGEICYYVKAIEAGANDYGPADTSVSNVRCFGFSPMVFIPTAFSPDGDGINDVYMPVVNFVDPTGYMLQIFDRFGKVIFESTNPAVGWDGNQASNGVYVYYLRLTNALDETIEYSGKVTLIR
ncbi:MAG: hypothetical protein Kow0075_12290 [Salibacteraceae bacterium]